MIRRLLRFPQVVFVTLFLYALTIFIAHYRIVGNSVWGDGRYYYVYVRSLVIDHDLDFSNERLVDPFYFDNIPTPLGRVGNKYSIGTPLFWMPAFILAHLIMLVLHALNPHLIADGYGHLYRLFIGFASVSFAVAGIYLSYLVARARTRARPALLAALTIALGSHLFYYLAVDPVNSHPVSIFIASLLVWIWYHNHTRLTDRSVIILGLLTGALGLVRNQDLIFALPLGIWLLTRPNPWTRHLRLALIYATATFAAFSLQLIVWYRLYGVVTSPYFLMGEGFDFRHLHLFSVLFGQNGLLITTPILILALIGLYLHRHTTFARIGLALFLLQWLLLSAWSGWWGGESFGGRMFLSLTPFFIVGLASLYRRLSSRLTLALTVGSILLTHALVLQYLVVH